MNAGDHPFGDVSSFDGVQTKLPDVVEKQKGIPAHLIPIVVEYHFVLLPLLRLVSVSGGVEGGLAAASESHDLAHDRHV